MMSSPKKNGSSLKLPPKPVLNQSCELLEKIYIFPEESDDLQSLADKKGLPFALEIEDIIMDKLHKEILVLRYSLAKTEEGVCPFYDTKKKWCGIRDLQPKSCKPLPLTFENVDEEHAKVILLGPLSTKYKKIELDDLETDMADNVDLLRQYYTRLEDGRTFITQLSANKEIEIDMDITFDEFEKRLNSWHPIGIIPSPENEENTPKPNDDNIPNDDSDEDSDLDESEEQPEEDSEE
jgi:Fe-S-cluster containining protein